MLTEQEKAALESAGFEYPPDLVAFDNAKARGRIEWRSDDGEDVLGFDLTGDTERDLAQFKCVLFAVKTALVYKDNPDLFPGKYEKLKELQNV